MLKRPKLLPVCHRLHNHALSCLLPGIANLYYNAYSDGFQSMYSSLLLLTVSILKTKDLTETGNPRKYFYGRSELTELFRVRKPSYGKKKWASGI